MLLINLAGEFIKPTSCVLMEHRNQRECFRLLSSGGLDLLIHSWLLDTQWQDWSVYYVWELYWEDCWSNWGPPCWQGPVGHQERRELHRGNPPGRANLPGTHYRRSGVALCPETIIHLSSLFAYYTYTEHPAANLEEMKHSVFSFHFYLFRKIFYISKRE